ncbi:hypothetical protein D6825_02095 [Candidatus Woesearchaeota archaeon]|nr:MAG: hypothetical protein D6825_02095 [Candidatus Woesearchaeota archaeon]
MPALMVSEEEMEPSDALYEAQQELKRADHSIAVSLKYTRTVDVIKGIIDRLINTIRYGLDALLIYNREKGNIEEVPELARLKAIETKKLYPDNPIVRDTCDFFLLLRKITKAEFDRAQEYRRHVTMTAHLDDGQSVQITIDIVTDYYARTKEFLKEVSKLISES